MNLSKMCLSAAVVMTLVNVLPASAQHRSRNPGRSSGRSVSRGVAPRPFGGVHALSAVPRSSAAPRVSASPRSVRGPLALSSFRSYAAPHVIGGGPVRSFSSPYYVFRPRETLAVGLLVGYPVAVPYYAPAYPYPSPYPYAPAYPSAVPGPTDGYGSLSSPTSGYSYAAIPQSPSTEVPAGDLGGLSFAITPGDAQVLVDGQVVGVVNSFSPSSQPLTLTPGHHHVEIRASGYRSVAWDVDITPGEVIPYYGTLQR